MHALSYEFKYKLELHVNPDEISNKTIIISKPNSIFLNMRENKCEFYKNICMNLENYVSNFGMKIYNENLF